VGFVKITIHEGKKIKLTSPTPTNKMKKLPTILMPYKIRYD
jgi:hypothetical protein